MMNVGASIKKLDDQSCCKDGYIQNPSMRDFECKKACKIDEYLDIENYSCEKRLFDKSV